MNDYLKRSLIPLAKGAVPRPAVDPGSSGASDDHLSPPPTPASSSYPTPASTALNTPRVSVSHSPETVKAALGPVIA